MDVSMITPAQARRLIRDEEWTKPTAGMCHGFIQANLVIIPKHMAYDFLLFCQRNPKPCPVIEVTDTGSAVPETVAPEADLRTDLPRYRVYYDGNLHEERLSITSLWKEDFTTFLLGCSFTFEQALLDNGIFIRHIEEKKNVPMYKTNIPCNPAGRFHGPMVVSMRPVKEKDLVRTVQVTSRFPSVHGAPVHIGSPDSIGIHDLNRPDFGDAVTVKEDEVPVFWACGVTPQAIAMQMKPEIMITHAPGHMFITNDKNETYSV
ncbi:putative hydro-lyase [Halobacillus salinarum]|uniref:Putative hydro-lyase MUN89_18655 n=1 Tax=Halobacillus salinarum TaxID=2932257 RepID=A0ABY4EP65_9BACI|nr:putative hydro-lyase [Halobacillus salinarum]UOQ43871.1 putative hydro-lyase [Halobacillus salinarum]